MNGTAKNKEPMFALADNLLAVAVSTISFIGVNAKCLRPSRKAMGKRFVGRDGYLLLTTLPVEP